MSEATNFRSFVRVCANILFFFSRFACYTSSALIFAALAHVSALLRVAVAVLFSASGAASRHLLHFASGTLLQCLP